MLDGLSLIEETAAYVVAIGAIFGGVLAVWKLFSPWLSDRMQQVGNFRASVAAIPQIVTVLREVRETLDANRVAVESSIDQLKSDFKREFTANGGATMRDLCDRLENRLIYQGSAVEHLMGLNQVSTFTTTPTGLVSEVSTSCCTALGVSEDKLLGNGWKSYIDSGDIDRVEEAWNRAVRDEIGALIECIEFHPRKHDFLLVTLRIEAIRDYKYRFMGHMGYLSVDQPTESIQ